MRDKDRMLSFRVNQIELERINQKREEIGIRNMGAYLRKMAMDGYCVNMDLKGVTELVRLLRICSNNLNQYAKKANETGSIYKEDIQDLQIRLNEIKDDLKEIMRTLYAIR
ncbi:plasmid mobilization protein [Blautia sp.]|uniref:plasmid mobilization protein n=1 Tax=Blautia sp. TaxID=1955243 RepID=UPI0026717554|nr:plasmid mobilization relaxosome protein MobC [uncultured Blautia sp.]